MTTTTTLQSLGFTPEEIDALSRIAHTLHRWHEMECGTESGCIERGDATGRPYWLNAKSLIRRPIADLEAGARRRLAAILERRNERVAGAPLEAYIQTDPRGAPIYLLRPGDIPRGKKPESYYTRGICVY